MWSLVTSECLIDNRFSPQAIERDHFTVEARFHTMLHYWARSTSPPNWSALVRALQSTAIGRVDIASRVETILVSVDVHTWLVVDVQSYTQSDELPSDDAKPPNFDIDPQGEFCCHALVAIDMEVKRHLISTHRSTQCRQALEDSKRSGLGSENKLE